MAEQPALSFAGLLRQLRAEARLTQEELAEAAAVSTRSVSDLERGVSRTAHKETARLLADALSLAEPARALFVAAARGRAPAAEVLAARAGQAPGPAAAATRALPRDIASFTGRGAELAQLLGAVDSLAAAGGVVGIHVIDGMAGSGKTTFAVHAAHRLAPGFPDGQFFLPLHAHTPGQRPVDPADALASLLLTAGVPAAQIPPGLEARAGRWRDQVAGKKILLLLDDAAGHQQVRPLLPGTAGSLVLVTSRRRLTALEDTAVVSLDTLPPGEAAALLVRLAARPGLRARDAAVREITGLCGYLPLAIGMLARQLRQHPAWTPGELAADLAVARDRLALMHAENLSVGAAFGLSYADLTPGQQRLFRRLGLVPGPDFDAYAAAALGGTSLDAARRGLDELYDQHLITEPAPGRYQLHDLLREHAQTLAAADGPAHGLVQSPVLVGRDDLLALAARRLADAAAGAGQLLFVAGEAGIGKTRLLGAVARRAQANGFAVVRAAAFPGDVQSLAGLLLDLASNLVPAPEPALSELGQNMASRVRAVSGDAGDAHRRRRLLVQDLADLIVSTRPGPPVLIILEDLHWADEVSLDVLGHLASRLATGPMLVAGTYRSDELYPQLPMRDLRGRLLGQRLAEEIRLPRLGLAQTAAMTSATLGRSAPAQLVQAIHERSDGIPLHVEEFLAAVYEDALTPQSGAAVHAAAVPDTLGDAVLTRARHLTTLARDVASAAAVIGRSFDFDLLTTISEADPDEVAGALRELQDAYLVLPGADAVSFDFRHALIRDTLYTDTGLPLRRRLHERVARAAADRGYRGAFISAHFEQAGHPGLAYEYAVAAAGEAVSLSAHSEALELYRRAARNLPAPLPPLDRAALFAALGDEAAATDDNKAAAEAYRTAHGLASGAGDVRTAAALAPRMVAVAHLLGDGLDVRIGTLRTALASLDGVPGTGHEHAQLGSAMAAAYLVDDRLDEAITHAQASRAESQRIGDEEAALDTAATLGSALVYVGRMDEGWELLEDVITRANERQQEAEAARGYRMIGSSASALVEYDRAERWLIEGIGYAENVELWNHCHYMASHLAHVQWATGQWGAATQTAQQALADGRGGITTRITAQWVLGYLAMGRGDWDTAARLLGEALAQGERMAELQRLSPPLWGLAEAARCQGDHDTALMLCERGFQASAGSADAAYLFPYLLTGVRAHLARNEANAAEAWLDRVAAALTARAIPGTRPAIDHGRGLVLLERGDLSAAHQVLQSAGDAWRERRRFWEGAWAQLDIAAAAAQARRLGEAAGLLGEVRTIAAAAGATALIYAADKVTQSFDRGPVGRTAVSAERTRIRGGAPGRGRPH